MKKLILLISLFFIRCTNTLEFDNDDCVLVVSEIKTEYRTFSYYTVDLKYQNKVYSRIKLMDSVNKYIIGQRLYFSKHE